MKGHPCHSWRNPLIMFIAILLVVPTFNALGLGSPASMWGVLGIVPFVVAAWVIAFVLGCSVDFLRGLVKHRD